MQHLAFNCNGIDYGERVRAFAAATGGTPVATVIGGRLRTSPGYAALANGTSSHSDELDGVHVSQNHPAGTSLAASLAVTESLGLGGPDLINAVVLSFDVGCRILTLGQYLRPSTAHLPVERYLPPEEFADLRDEALALGFDHVEAGPLVRSSYHAWSHVPPETAQK